jgi:hypothetical protein
MSDSHGISLYSTTLQPSSDIAWAVHQMHAGGQSWCINSGTTSPIHRKCSDFTSIAPNSGSVTGFNQSTSHIKGRGTVQLIVASPSGGVHTVHLNQAMLIPEAKDSPVSVCRFNNAKCYTVFGAGRSLIFHLDDGGQFVQNVLHDQKVVMTGTSVQGDSGHLTLFAC